MNVELGILLRAGHTTDKQLVIRKENVDGQPYVCLMVGDDQVKNAEEVCHRWNCHEPLLAACKAFLASISLGVKEISEQGVESAAFASRADETTAALRDMKAAIAKAAGIGRKRS